MTESMRAGLLDLQRLIARLNSGPDLRATLQAVVDGVVEGLGFSVAVVNLVHDDGQVEVLAVAGPQEVSDALLGQRGPIALWHRQLEQAEPWGSLRYLPHTAPDLPDLPTWVPDTAVPADPRGWHPLDALFAPLRAASGELVGILSVDLPDGGQRPDQTQRELLEMYASLAGIAIDNARLTERLRASEESFRLAFENAPVGMAIVDLTPGSEGRYLRVNEAMCRMLNYSRRELRDRSALDVTHPDDRASSWAALKAALDDSLDLYEAEKRYLRRDGGIVWVALRTSVVRAADGTPLFGISQFEDISDRRAVHQELTRQVRVDPLTGLLNRTGLTEHLRATVEEARRTGRPGAVLFCDLDGFKPVNDSHGHQVGDEVLGIVARRLESQVRGADTAARFGGDEFVVVTQGLTAQELDDLVARLKEAVGAPLDVNGVTITLSMTVGSVLVSGAEAETPEGLLAAADFDMYLQRSRRRAARRRG